MKIENLDLIALPNYYLRNKVNRESEYNIHFDISGLYKPSGMNLVYIGEENIFQTGNIQSLIWEELNTIPVFIKLKKGNKIFYTEIDNYIYYVQTSSPKEKNNRHLLIFDKLSNSIIFDKNYNSSESSYLSELTIKNKKYEFKPSTQWTGRIFKNKPPIIDGFHSLFYNGRKIVFLSEEEPPISVVVDDRN